MPPLPVDKRVHDRARERRDLLMRSATFGGWEVLNLGRITNDDIAAMALAEHAYTRYPIGNARTAIQEAIAEALLK